MSPAVAITTLGLLTNTTTTLYQHSTTPSQHHPRSLLLAGPKTFTLPRYLLESPNPSPPLPSVAVFQLFYCTVTAGRAKRFLFLALFSCPLQHFYFHGKVLIWTFSSFFFFFFFSVRAKLRSLSPTLEYFCLLATCPLR